MAHVSGSELERAVAIALPELLREGEGERGAGGLYRHVIERVERPLLRQVLQQVGGNQVKAARLLGINRNTLRKRLRALGLVPARSTGAAALAPGPPAA